MSTDDAAVETVMRVLTEWGAAEPGADGIHSWRCSYPERFGPCSCADEFCHEVAVALADRHRADVDEPWPFGSESAAVLVAKTAWPYDAHASDWARRLANELEMRESTTTRAEARLRSAVAHLRNEADQ